MNASRIYALVLRQYYLIRDNPTRFTQLFLWALLDIVLWGFLTKYLGSIMGETLNVASVLLGAVLLWDFLTRVMNGVTVSFFEDVWARNFLNIFSSPITIPEYITALVISAIATSAVGLLAMLALAAAFGFSIVTYGALAAPYLLVLFLTGIALGILSVGIVLRFGPSAEWFIWPIPTIISPFVGVLYPVSVLPEWMQWVSQILPPTYVFEGMRALVGGASPDMKGSLIGIVLSIFYIFLAYLFFARIFKEAVRTGRIARYSAETS